MLFCRKHAFQSVVVLAVVSLALAAFARPPETSTDTSDTYHHRRVVVASPRASIIRVANRDNHDDSTTIRPMAGAAHNFPSHPIHIVIRRDTVVVFRDSLNMEAVWYAHTYGRITTRLIIQRAVMGDNDELQWVTIGKDGARGKREGPSIGHTDVKVRHRFRRVGRYYLRADCIAD